MRSLRESQLYALNLASFGDVARIDDILTGITWALCYMPEEFPLMKGTFGLRLVKSEPVKIKGTKVRLRVWFTIIDEQIVELLNIDTISWPP